MSDSRLLTRQLLVLALAAAGLHTGPASAAGAPPLAWFAGAWQCAGKFEASGKPIEAQLRFEWSEGSGALVKHHDDRLPNSYHAIELWGANGPAGLAATIVDTFSGTRLFASPGWANETLAWTRMADGKPVERFTYAREGQDRLKVEWATSKDGSTFKLGDTLFCERLKAE